MSTVFKISGGYCHILPSYIALLKNETIPENSVLPTGKAKLPPVYILLAVAGLLLCGAGIYGCFTGALYAGLVVMVVGVTLFAYGYRHFMFSRVSVIERDQIIEIRFGHGVPGRTASRFRVFYIDENGRTQERPIVLTNHFHYNEENALQAISIMNRIFTITE
jgi:hypothetical protein